MFKLGSRVILAAAAFATFIYSWDTNMMQPVLPFYVQQNASALGIDPKAVGAFLGMVMGLYALINCGGNLVFGWASDIRGRRLILTIGFLGCAIALLFYERMTSGGGLLAVRTIHGFFSGALAPCTAAILADISPPERRGMSMALWAVFFAVGTMVASPIAGWLKASYGAGMVWLVMAIFYFLVTIIVWLFIPETRKVATPASPAQAAPTSESKARVSRWGFLSHLNVWIACIGIMALFWTIGTWVTAFSRHLNVLSQVKVIGVDPSVALGMLMGIQGLAIIAFGGFLGRLCDLIGRKPLLIAAFAFLTVSPFLVSTYVVPLIVIGWGIFFGLAAAMVWSSIMAVLTDELAPHERGTGIGFFMVFPTLGIGIGSPVVGSLSDMFGNQIAIMIGAFLPLIALVLSTFARRRVECKPVTGRLKMYLAIVSVVYL
ncbi:MAG: MFS transporter, partial [Dehalococcoidia bacterium]|nr:MFS transporter [Dehalococcoidia bacterium]